jgi:hypothetical protein
MQSGINILELSHSTSKRPLCEFFNIISFFSLATGLMKFRTNGRPPGSWIPKRKPVFGECFSGRAFRSNAMTPLLQVLLHPLVIRPTSTLRRDPRNDLVGIGDVAGLAMHAV